MTEEFEVGIMIEVVDRRDAWVVLSSVKLIASEPWLERHRFNDSEMALFSECLL